MIQGRIMKLRIITFALAFLLSACGSSDSTTQVDDTDVSTGTDGNSATGGGTGDNTNVAWQLDKIELVELNGDEHIDLLLSYQSDSSLSKLSYRTNLTDGHFSEEVVIDDQVSDKVQFVTAGDIDGNGNPDIVVTTTDAIHAYFATSAVNFSAPVSLSSNWSLNKHFDGQDNTQIILPVRSESSRVKFLLADLTGNGVMDFTWVSYAQPSDTFSGQYFHLLYRAINDGSGYPETPVLLDSATRQDASDTYDYLSLLDPSDIKGDGILDLVIEHVKNNGMSQVTEAHVRWFSGTNTNYVEVETTPDPIPVFYRPTQTLLVDWDEDGNLDIISWLNSVNHDGSTDALFINNGNGDFLPYQDISANEVIIAEMVIDLDNDGKEDFINFGLTQQGSENNAEVTIQRKEQSTVEVSQKLFDYQGEMKGAYDLNNDGYMDFVSQTENALYWYQNKGDLTFAEIEINITE